MTVQELLLLQKMKKAQRKPDDPVIVDTFCNTIETGNVYAGLRKTVEPPKLLGEGELSGTLASLENFGYIESLNRSLDEGDTYAITHKGLHVFQHMIWSLLHFLSASVVVPIIVSILTTWITLLVFGCAPS
mgnify:CR=1 FL=1